MRTRKETSECEVRAALIRTESTGKSGLHVQLESVLGNNAIQVAHCGDGSCVSFPRSLGAPRLPP